MVNSQIGLIALSATVVMCLSGCASYKAPFQPPNGLFYGSYRAPVQTEMGEKGAEVVETCGTSSASFFRVPLPFVYWLSFAWDDCSVEQAAKNGRLTNVNYADVEFYHVLGIYCKTTYTAYGSTIPRPQ
jgi:hypothetical protein